MISVNSCCCFTGYRPEKFGFDFEESNMQYRRFMARLATAISVAIESGVTEFYTGMARGFDIIAAEHVALIKKFNKKIHLTAVVPFKGQEKNFPEEWKTRYYSLLESCDEVVTLNDKYEKWAFDQRNRYMVDRCRNVITYFDGKCGGTQNTVNYALRHCRKVVNIYDTDPMEEQNGKFKAYFRLIPPDGE